MSKLQEKKKWEEIAMHEINNSETYKNKQKSKKRSKVGKVVIRIVGVFLVIIAGVFIYWSIPYSPYRASLNKTINERLKETPESEQVYTKEEIAKLPEPMQRYFNYIGVVGQKRHNVVNIVCKDTYFLFDEKTNKELKINYNLWLFADKPFRLAYIGANANGIPFEGMDYGKNNEGGMKGMLGKAIQIFDTHNEQMAVAGLLSWVGEAATNPTILLTDYITYKEIDKNHVEATVTYNGITGKGTFTIDDEGKITEFFSTERQVVEIDGVITPIGWRGEYEDYKEKDGIKVPTVLRAINVYPDREVIYFDSDKQDINYFK